MDKGRIQQLLALFDGVTHSVNNEGEEKRVEIWFACGLQSILGYVRWENFEVVILRAMDLCKKPIS